MNVSKLDRQGLMEMMAGYQPACVVGAAAELEVFSALGDQSLSSAELTSRLEVNPRALTMLLDALAALGVLEKEGERYQVPVELRPLLRSDGPETYLPMIWHRMVILRGWANLAWTVKAGIPAPRPASIRGAAADSAAFIAAMHSVSGPLAAGLVARFGPPPFTQLLDVGGASGTWTLAFLRARPGTRAVIFDLPHAIDQAQARFAGTEFADRVSFSPGDFYQDELPKGADLAWVSAIVHQNSRSQNRELFAKVHRALTPGGLIGIRDIVMEPDRTRPVEGALFAINMLVNTPSGTTFTFAELAEDLQAAGFHDPKLAIQDKAMSSVVTAVRP
ncbi:MAG: methyltransferase [Isosphaeraceae bacterium]